MRDLELRTAYITGGSSGIGFALAKELKIRGVDLVLLARDRRKLEAAREKLLNIGDNPSSVNILSLDISQKESVETDLAKAVKDYGVPDLLVNCAGMAYPNYFHKIPYPQFQQTLETNIAGTWNVLQALVPGMMEKGRGKIVTLSSIAGFIGVFGYTAYSASKFALFGMMEALRGELKPYGISVHVVCPPDTDTPQLAEEEKSKPPETKAVSGNSKVLGADFVARTILSGIKGNKFIIIPGLSGKLIYRISRLFPGLVRSIMDNDIKKARKKL